MAKYLLTVSLLVALGVGSAAQANSGQIVAVFDIEDKGVGLKPTMLDGLTDYLATRIAEVGGYQVIPRGEMKSRLSGSKRSSHKTCYDQSCQIELGKELAAEKIIATKLIKLGSRCTVASTLYDLKKSVTESAATVHGKCGEDDIVNSLDQTVLKLMGKAADKSKASSSKTGKDNCRKGIKTGTIKRGVSYRQLVSVLGEPDVKEKRTAQGSLKLVYQCEHYQPIPKPDGCRIYTDSEGRVTVNANIIS